MSITGCGDTGGGIAVYDRLQDLPAGTRALFDHAVRRDLFDSAAWYGAVVASAMPPDAAPRFVAYHQAGAAVLLVAMQTLRHGRALTSLTTPYTCRYQPLCDPAADAAAVRAGFAAFARDCRRWPAVRLDALDAAAPWLPVLMEGAAAAGLAVRRFDHFGNWHEDVAGQGWADYLASRPGSLRETIRRRVGRAERSGARFELVMGGAALEPGIAAYQSVYARSWKPDEPFPQFNPTLMRALASRGLLRLGLYWQGVQPVAAQLWVLDGGTAMVLKLAHDEAANAASPGTVLTSWMLRCLLDQEQVTDIDFGRGDDPYKRLWARTRRQRIGIVLVNPRHPRGLAFLARHALGQVRRALMRLCADRGALGRALPPPAREGQSSKARPKRDDRRGFGNIG
jgi:CelD/BcsL family acetyltransferase involved in cellulose biosynthesis